MKRIFLWAAPLPLMLPLAGCGDSAPPPALYCPNVAVLQQASTTTLFVPGRQDIGGTLTQAQLTPPDGDCTLAGKDRVRVKFRANFLASNGPADNGKPLALHYFVSTSSGDTILSKTEYTQPVDFSGNLQAATAAGAPVVLAFPDQAATAGVDVLIGFDPQD